jgi:hypothetical protein
MTQRISYGKKVPALLSDVPIKEKGKANFEDFEREAIPKKLQGTEQVDYKQVVGNFINKDLLTAWDNYRKTAGYQSQGQAMLHSKNVSDESATKVAKAEGFTETVSNKGWEWLHIIAFSMSGHKGYPQYAPNMGGGTWHANSAHKIVEDAVKQLTRDAPNEVFLVDGFAAVFKGTEIAAEFRYVVSTSQPVQSKKSFLSGHPGRSVEFAIDTLGRTTPTSHDTRYYYLLLAAQLLSQKPFHELAATKVTEKLPKGTAFVDPPYEFSPPSPPHYSQFTEADLRKDFPAEIIEGGKKLKDADLVSLRKRPTGAVDKPYTTFSSKRKYTDDIDVMEMPVMKKGKKPAKNDFTVPVNDLDKKWFSNATALQIVADVKASGQYWLNEYTATDAKKYRPVQLLKPPPAWQLRFLEV